MLEIEKIFVVFCRSGSIYISTTLRHVIEMRVSPADERLIYVHAMHVNKCLGGQQDRFAGCCRHRLPFGNSVCGHILDCSLFGSQTVLRK